MRLVIISTRNGWCVVEGHVPNEDTHREEVQAFRVIPRTESYNSLDRCIAGIRKIIESWHKPENEIKQ